MLEALDAVMAGEDAFASGVVAGAVGGRSGFRARLPFLVPVPAEPPLPARERARARLRARQRDPFPRGMLGRGRVAFSGAGTQAGAGACGERAVAHSDTDTDNGHGHGRCAAGHELGRGAAELGGMGSGDEPRREGEREAQVLPPIVSVVDLALDHLDRGQVARDPIRGDTFVDKSAMHSGRGGWPRRSRM